MNKRNFFVSAAMSAIFTILIIAQNAAGQTVIYDNGPFITGTVSKNGVAAPFGKQWSELQNDNGVTNQTNAILGYACLFSPNSGANIRCADDFIVPVGETWTINQVVVYLFQNGAMSNPVSNMNLRIWNGKPESAGSTLVFGDTTTNRFASGADTNSYRIPNTVFTQTNPVTLAPIWEERINVSPAVVLTAGTYWIDFQSVTSLGQFTPMTTYVGARSVPLNNARQFGNGWYDVLDPGSPQSSPDVGLDIPFKLEGSKTGVAPIPRNRWMDFDGDNISDYVIARTNGAPSQSIWWIKNSGGTIFTYSNGFGVGFAGGNIAAPADYDGDGKTDIAVWQPTGSNSTGFLILESTTNALRFEPFGQAGDDPTIVRDYDGDGKADAAVFRPGAQATFYYRGTLNNPNGNITFVQWGITGDRALPGDFDGDGRADFSILRNNGGLAEHWQLFASGASRAFQYGLNTDKFLTGDYDLDNRSDVAAVRSDSGFLIWYVFKSSDLATVAEIYGSSATDFPLSGDYDGDGRSDFAVWRSGTSAEQEYFFVRNSHSARTQTKWGESSGNLTAPDYPVANFIVK
jgi:FG-GAP-like repeat